MSYEPRPDLMEPTLELWIDAGPGRETTVRCAGRLDTATRRSLLGVVRELIDDGTPEMFVDITDLEVDDVDGANALTAIQRLASSQGRRLVWRGVDQRHVQGGTPVNPAA